MPNNTATPIPEEWELTPGEKITITDSLCKKYKTTWEEMVKGSLSATNLEQLIIDVYDTVADAAVAKCAPLAAKREQERILEYLKALLKSTLKASLTATIALIEATKL